MKMISLSIFGAKPKIGFALKVGLAGGAVYYISERGVWGNSVQTTKLSKEIGENIKPYWQQAQTHIPVELPELPNTNRLSYVSKQYWNKGVSGTFSFLGNLPNHINTWTKKGIDAVMSYEGVKDLVGSFSTTPPVVEQMGHKGLSFFRTQQGAGLLLCELSDGANSLILQTMISKKQTKLW